MWGGEGNRYRRPGERTRAQRTRPRKISIICVRKLEPMVRRGKRTREPLETDIETENIRVTPAIIRAPSVCARVRRNGGYGGGDACRIRTRARRSRQNGDCPSKPALEILITDFDVRLSTIGDDVMRRGERCWWPAHASCVAQWPVPPPTSEEGQHVRPQVDEVTSPSGRAHTHDTGVLRGANWGGSTRTRTRTMASASGGSSHSMGAAHVAVVRLPARDRYP